MERILILDDEADMLETCRRILAAAGHESIATTAPREALELLASERPDVLLTDLRMPSMDGIDLLRRAHEIDPSLPVIMLTAYATIESAVAAVREGAFDYLAKPFTLDQLVVSVERALAQRRLTLENKNLRDQLQQTFAFENIAGRSAALHRALELVRKAARSEANVLVLGESGTGKELIARAIHANSPRAKYPFVPVDCASLPENLLESELFGHEKGAFTGAAAAKLGLMETADRGSLFLDEIGELPQGLQAKLLRAIQERRIRRVGGTREIAVDVRVVSATNRNLRELAGSGEFREDLFYRINVIDIVLPPLRDRKGDVTLLAYIFLRNFTDGRPGPRGFTAEALELLETYDWPGNIRELRNVVERACALADAEMISPVDFPAHLAAQPPHPGGSLAQASPAAADNETLKLTLKEAKERWVGQLEASYVAEVLRREGGNVSQAARAAGVDRKTLHRLLNKHRVR